MKHQSSLLSSHRKFHSCEMDLLRLVLSKQPLDGVRKFSRLLQNKAFREMKLGAFGAEKYSHELSSHTSPTRDSVNRALFLQHVGYYLHLTGICSEEIGLVEALASGIPEIQARVLSLVVLQDKRKERVTMEDYGLFAVPWTKTLWNLTREVLEKTNYSNYWAGFFLLPKMDNPSQYMRGYIEARTHGKDVLERNEEIETAFSSLFRQSIEEHLKDDFSLDQFGEILIITGYIFPLLRFPIKGNLAETAFSHASHTLLKRADFTGVTFETEADPDRFYVKRVSTIMDDTDLVTKIPEAGLQLYRVILGYDVQPTTYETEKAKAAVGIPFDVDMFEINDFYDFSQYSFARVFYAPEEVTDNSLPEDYDLSLIYEARRLGRFELHDAVPGDLSPLEDAVSFSSFLIYSNLLGLTFSVAETEAVKMRCDLYDKKYAEILAALTSQQGNP